MGSGEMSGGMKVLVTALSLIAVAATGLVIYLVIGWWDDILKDPNVASILVWSLPIWALDFLCIKLWIAKRPQP